MTFTGIKIIRTVILSALMFALAASLSAQITINIPNIPKFGKKKEKAQQTTPAAEETESQTASSGRSQERPSAPSSPCKTDYKLTIDDIVKVKEEAESFTPGRIYYVTTLSDRKNEYFEAALSPSARQKFIAGRADFGECVNPALDDLAAVARKTLPTYTGPSNYTLGTLAEKKTLLSAIGDIGQANVLKVGLVDANWLIDKDRYNFPTDRVKRGVIVAKYPNADHGYCWLFWVNLVQDYAGGGTYGASYGNYMSRHIAGCPAGK